MRKEEEIRAKVAECIDNLRELADEIDFDAEDLIVYDRSELHLSTLLWALNEPPPEEVQKLADSVLQKFRQAKGLPDDWPKGSLKRKKS